ncbi:MAG: TrpR-like protein, YerC/YecD [Clostridia bacterium]|nr:TrpR-like protein, YerC/YecD [Clostridia bacterium]
MNKSTHKVNCDYLFEAVLRLQSKEECYAFFEDLCTIPELRALSQRLVVAKMLTDGVVYTDIVAATGASTATISRVNRSLNYGANGYGAIFERLDNDGVKPDLEP